jgi:putative PEP-CTERM system TPR-repeat lipoprotein
MLLCAALPAAQANDAKASRFYEDALTRYEKHDIPGTIIQLKNALQADRKMLPVHVLLGKALLANGEAPAAEAAFTEALRLGVNRAEVVLPLAQAVVDQGNQQSVIDDPRFALAGLPQGVQSQLLLTKAAAYSDVGDARGAMKAVESARAIEPDAVEVWLAEVPIRIRAQQFKEALAAVAKARTLDPNSAQVHYQYGEILHVQGDLVGAIAAYDKALTAEPAFADARVARAGLNVDLKRNDEAAKDVDTLLEQSPHDPRGWYLRALLAERDGNSKLLKSSLHQITALLDPVPIGFIRYRPQMLLLNGQAHFGLGETEKAKPLFEAFQRVQPGSPVSKLLANIYLSEKNFDRAIESLELYLRAFPGDSQAMALLASANMAKGRNARAASLMQNALRSKDAPELYTAYGLSLLGSGRPADAITQLETAYRKDPGQLQAAYALVGLYLRNEQTAKAMAVAQALVKRKPGNASFQNLLGMARAQHQDAPGARAAFEQSIQLDPTFAEASLNLARLEMRTGGFERSQALLDGVLKADDRNTEAMYEQAALAERRGKAADSLRWLQKAFDVAGAKDLRSALALVDLHMRQGRRADALKVAQQIAADRPDELPVLLALARVQIANADGEGARATLTTATRLADFDAPVQVEIALLQLAVNNAAGAAYSLDKALSSKPDFPPALAAMVDLDIRQGDFAKAEQRIHQVLQRLPKQAIGHSLMGDLAIARRQWPQAVEAYRKAHQVQPSIETLGHLSRALAIQDPKAGQAVIEQWLKNRPDDVPGRKMLAEALVRRGDMAGARRELEHLHQAVPKDAGVTNNLANVLIQLNDPKAAAVAELALAAQPNNVIMIDTAGWAAYQAGNYSRSLELLRDARLRAPESKEIRYHLASALVKSGRPSEAREELEYALRSKQGFDGRGAAEALLRTLK